ncbi:MAG: LD-carboxypeptidase [Acidobacteria bacterium]|nr:LD-carboxypeptidase [Acidobacteriota bacterium]
MIMPPPLHSRSRIRIPVPASPVRQPFLDSGLNTLAQQRWSVEIPERGFATLFYCAGPDDERATDVIDALRDNTADAVWFARGGYGSGRLLPFLDKAFPQPPERPKILVGCSDITFLLLYALQRWQWVVFHGPMVAGDLAREGYADVEYLVSLLSGRPVRAEVSATPLEVLQDGPVVRAPLTGGCLSVVASTLATPYEIDTAGKILFLEDAFEKPYRVDRLLTQLRQSGKLAQCAGIVFGEMMSCVQHPDQRYSIQEALKFAVRGVTCPILFGLASGHTSVPSLTLALGADYRLDPTARQLFLEDQRLCPSD